MNLFLICSHSISNLSLKWWLCCNYKLTKFYQNIAVTHVASGWCSLSRFTLWMSWAGHDGHGWFVMSQLFSWKSSELKITLMDQWAEGFLALILNERFPYNSKYDSEKKKKVSYTLGASIPAQVRGADEVPPQSRWENQGSCRVVWARRAADLFQHFRIKSGKKRRIQQKSPKSAHSERIKMLTGSFQVICSQLELRQSRSFSASCNLKKIALTDDCAPETKRS